MEAHGETGWLADLTYYEGRFEPNLAMFVDGAGRITRFSRAAAAQENARRLPHRAILPGLVNVHSHAFQRVIRGRTEHRSRADGDTFWTWREAMYQAANLLSPEDIYAAARMAFLEMALSGITTAGEFHYLHHAHGGARYEDPNLLAEQVLEAGRAIGIRVALLRAAYARSGYRKPADPRQARFITADPEIFLRDTDDLRAAVARRQCPGMAWVGVAPHSVRALPLDSLLAVSQYARTRGLKVHMHVAEQPAEVEECLAESGLRPVELLEAHGILDPSFTAVHAIHLETEEIQALGAAHAHVCACPTTERNLGDGIVAAGALAAAGVGICFGSDSNVQIDLLEDARSLEYHLRLNRLERAVLAPQPGMEALAARLFGGATEVGADALGAPGGLLEVGRPADFFTIDLRDVSIAGAGDALLPGVVFSLERPAIRDVFVNGRAVVSEGGHALQEEVVREFEALQRRLWG